MMGTARVSWVIMVVCTHTIHSRVHNWWALTRAILCHHSSRRGTRLIITSIGAVLIHLTQFRLGWARSTAMEHSLVVNSVPLMLMVERGIGLLGEGI